MATVSLTAELVLVFCLSILRRFAARISDAICRAPLLDVLVAFMTIAPAIVGFVLASWVGMAGAIAGQLAALPTWILIHEQVHRAAARGPRLVKAQNAIVGGWRHHVALWVSVTALPLFWAVRLGEILVYPPLRWLLGFPKYRHGDWINVSRHKFEGLVGHDLIWCLHCDWMTGIYSLAGEMLRNIESFWCPIRFHEGKKCEYCKVDFPDIDEWANVNVSTQQAVDLLGHKYADGHRELFGQPEDHGHGRGGGAVRKHRRITSASIGSQVTSSGV